nr:protein phosphatase 2C [Hymenolepis microstoma]
MSARSTTPLLLDIKNSIFPDVSANIGSSVRLRSKPVMGKVKKVHAAAYVMANISRCLCANIQENNLIDQLLGNIRSNMSPPLDFISECSDYCSFDELQRRGMDSLKQALLKTIDLSQSKSDFFHSAIPSSVDQFSVSSVVNKRRRQEDRWFFEPDLIAYVPLDERQAETLAKLRGRDYPQIVGCGIFDGHGGPEAAEHCSNLAPFLLSRRLQSRFLEECADKRSSQTLPDILSDVLHELNLSVTECHRQKLWNSGTTATICLIYEDYIYTAWIGDSQGVLFKTTMENKSTISTITSSSTTKSTPSHSSLNIKPTMEGSVEKPIFQTDVLSTHAAAVAADIPHIDSTEATLPRSTPSSKQTVPQPLHVESIRNPSIAASALISPTSPRTRAARWGLPFSWLTSLVRGGGNFTGPNASSKESSPPAVEIPQTPILVRAPLATQEVEEADLIESSSPPKSIPGISLPGIRRVPPFRYGSLPIGGKKKDRPKEQNLLLSRNKTSAGTNVPSKRLSAHFSEPSLNVASGEKDDVTTVDPADMALSAGHRISPAGDMRDSRSISFLEKSNSDATQPTYSVLTPNLHRPEYPVEFVSILRAGGCVTFKASEEYLVEEESEDTLHPTDRLGRRLPAPVMNSAQLLFVPNLSVNGTYRVGGISGVTRSLGAGTSLIPGLSALPSLSVHRIHPSTSPSCLILATDGLWDTYSCGPDDLTHFFTGTPNREFAKLLTARAIRNGSSDNVTILILWIGDRSGSNAVGGGNDAGPMEIDIRSPAAYPIRSRCASVPTRGDWRLRGPLVVGGFGEESGKSSIPRYVELPTERVFGRSHSLEDLADEDIFRASSPMRIVP